MPDTPDNTSANFDYDELVILTRWMADQSFDAGEIADAVEKPWKYQDWLTIAKRGGSADEIDDLNQRQSGVAASGRERAPKMKSARLHIVS
jgi:hypothetical protein